MLSDIDRRDTLMHFALIILVCNKGYYRNNNSCTKCSTDESQTTVTAGAIEETSCGKNLHNS